MSVQKIIKRVGLNHSQSHTQVSVVCLQHLDLHEVQYLWPDSAPMAACCKIRYSPAAPTLHLMLTNGPHTLHDSLVSDWQVYVGPRAASCAWVIPDSLDALRLAKMSEEASRPWQ
jgi:hypothetical protein